MGSWHGGHMLLTKFNLINLSHGISFMMLLSAYMSVRPVSIKWSSSSLMRPDHCTISRCYKWELDWLHIFIPCHLNKVSKWDSCQKSIIELAYHITFMPGTYIAFTNGFHLILGLLQFDWGWLSINHQQPKYTWQQHAPTILTWKHMLLCQR